MTRAELCHPFAKPFAGCWTNSSERKALHAAAATVWGDGALQARAELEIMPVGCADVGHGGIVSSLTPSPCSSGEAALFAAPCLREQELL